MDFLANPLYVNKGIFFKHSTSSSWNRCSGFFLFYEFLFGETWLQGHEVSCCPLSITFSRALLGVPKPTPPSRKVSSDPARMSRTALVHSPQLSIISHFPCCY